MFRIFPSRVKTIVLQLADMTYRLDVLCTELYKKGTSFECQCIWNESANWGHFLRLLLESGPPFYLVIRAT